MRVRDGQEKLGFYCFQIKRNNSLLDSTNLVVMHQLFYSSELFKPYEKIQKNDIKAHREIVVDF